MDNFYFFGLNLGKLLNYVQYFGSNIVDGVAESWVETEMSWVEVDGAGWSWLGARFSNIESNQRFIWPISKKLNRKKSLYKLSIFKSIYVGTYYVLFVIIVTEYDVRQTKFSLLHHKKMVVLRVQIF